MAGKMRDFRQEIQEEHREFSRARGMPSEQRQLLDSVRKRNWVKVEKMLTRGVDVRMTDDTDTPLLHVVSQSNVNEDTITTMKTLLYFGADPEATDRFGRSPLHLAVASSSQLVKVLLEAGSFPNKQDNAGRSPLMEACGSESPDALVTVSMLMDSHCNVHLRDEMGNTALHCVCRNKKQDLDVRNEIALKLLLAGASASVTDNAGKMAVCYELERFVNASGSQQFKESRFLLVRTLVQAGSRFNPRNKSHERWLKYVSLYSSIHLLKHLLNIALPTLPLSALKKLPSLTSAADGTAAENFQKELRTLSRSVRSLQDLSRIAIREILKGKVLPSVSMLPLPQKIQMSVALQS